MDANRGFGVKHCPASLNGKKEALTIFKYILNYIHVYHFWVNYSLYIYMHKLHHIVFFF